MRPLIHAGAPPLEGDIQRAVCINGASQHSLAAQVWFLEQHWIGYARYVDHMEWSLVVLEFLRADAVLGDFCACIDHECRV